MSTGWYWIESVGHSGQRMESVAYWYDGNFYADNYLLVYVGGVTKFSSRNWVN